ncbi:MAG: tRNA 4-thiouridine(8) synthase ThiI [Spirochaetaceae bacterium]|nr:tRNA 4-thiouridine(8) synthase ThiI [Spirochaetaceae bacterium]
MYDSLYLLKTGELALKGGNKSDFVKILNRNLVTMLKTSGAQTNNTDGRIYVHCMQESETYVEDVLNHLCGITGWAKAHKAEKSIDAVLCAVTEEAKRSFLAGFRTFKIEARRTDKSFPLTSYQLCAQAGEAVINSLPGFTVDVHNPQITFFVEIREKAYIYGTQNKGLRGLPVGTAGRGLLLLSGGIDSPVAGFLIALRGMKINAVYFHAYPYTSDDARLKVVKIAEILGRYSMGIKLNTVSFTDVQIKIKEAAPEEWRTILLRMAMMEAASIIASQQKCKCLITGESLSQVASQTIENIACTESRVNYPVLRPLIGLDKESITKISEKIGTYKTSILPYQDCCVLFSPPHPILHGNKNTAKEIYESLQLQDIIYDACKNRTTEKCGFWEQV